MTEHEIAVSLVTLSDVIVDEENGVLADVVGKTITDKNEVLLTIEDGEIFRIKIEKL